MGASLLSLITHMAAACHVPRVRSQVVEAEGAARTGQQGGQQGVIQQLLAPRTPDVANAVGVRRVSYSCCSHQDN